MTNDSSDAPLAYLMTWTVYGSHLQGAATGWRKNKRGEQPAQPLLEAWHRERLKHSVICLDMDQRKVVEAEVLRHCQHRSWTLWACHCRSNHVHAVVTATSVSGQVVRDQLKANCTRGLRERWPIFQGRPVWTMGGDWRCLNTDESLGRAVEYVIEVQDRKGRDDLPSP